MVVLPITGCAVLVVINPAGPVHIVFTDNGMSITLFSSTVQITVIPVPTGLTGMETLLDTTTEAGPGTGKEE